MITDYSQAIAEFVSATGCSCDTASALLAAHGWCLQPALAEALGFDAEAAADQERSDRAVAAALEAEGRLQAEPTDAREFVGRADLDQDFAAALAAADGGPDVSMREQEQLLLLQEQSRRDVAIAEREQFDLLRAFEQQKQVMSPGQSQQAVSLSIAAVEVRDFLDSARLPQFFDSFVAHGYDEMAVVKQMSSEDMDEVGLKGGHKIKFREALKATEQVAKSELEAPIGGLNGESSCAAQPSPECVPSASHVSVGIDAVRSDELASSPSPGFSQSVPQGSIDSTPKEALCAELNGQEPAESPEGGDSHDRGRQGRQSRGGAEGLLALARGRTRSQQRRVIKDGRITFVDE